MNDYPNQAGRPVQTVNRGGVDAPVRPSGKKKFSFNYTKVVAAVLITSVTILLLALVVYTVSYKNNDSTDSKVKTGQYQAVFLNSADGQVYFGKLKTLNAKYYQLNDIYYVRVNQVQPDKNQQAQTNISLAKLGNEIHGPEDVMYINKDDVMFWENLKEDGQVVKAIREYQKNGNKTPATTPATNTTTNP
jgi:hypothetical protein